MFPQDWRERGEPEIPRILETYKVCGNAYTKDSSAMAYAWCAAFVLGSYTAGIVKSSKSGPTWYNWGSEVDSRDTGKIRKWTWYFNPNT